MAIALFVLLSLSAAAQGPAGAIYFNGCIVTL
jgi:hypothetical protein